MNSPTTPDSHNALTFGEMETTIEEEEAFANLSLQEQFERTLAKQRVIVIYHANCADGFTAAWVFHKAASLLKVKFKFVEGRYGEAPPDVTDAIVYLVDFSYKKEVVRDMLQIGGAQQVIFIDHHISAINDLASLPDELEKEWEIAQAELGDASLEEEFESHFLALTSVEKSGATLAWEFWEELFQDYNYPKPLLLDHIEDRDLWKFKLPLTESLSTAVFSYEYTFENWNMLMSNDTVGLVTLAASAQGITRKHKKDVAELLKATETVCVIDGKEVPCANLPYIFASDAGHIMASRPENTTLFAATYYDSPTDRVFSLRSAKDTGMDVSVIASKYGGGGHKNAAGFKVSLFPKTIEEAARMPAFSDPSSL
jgi:oligoribonuclease NrnB/cAMP/cGMP phosphodiesterase (DHH superfamily)